MNILLTIEAVLVVEFVALAVWIRRIEPQLKRLMYGEGDK